MLTCTLPALSDIRTRAKRLQSFTASKLRIKYHSHFDQTLIDRFLFATWVPHPTYTRRIWLGTWSPQLLAALLPPGTTSECPMPTSDRYKYRKFIRKLTFPLIFAYRQMLKLHRPSAAPTTPLPHLPTPRERYRTGLLLPQHTAPEPEPSLHTQRHYLHLNPFTLSDTANSITETSVGLHRKTS
jgi:hypothetical protein